MKQVLVFFFLALCAQTFAQTAFPRDSAAIEASYTPDSAMVAAVFIGETYPATPEAAARYRSLERVRKVIGVSWMNPGTGIQPGWTTVNDWIGCSSSWDETGLFVHLRPAPDSLGGTRLRMQFWLEDGDLFGRFKTFTAPLPWREEDFDARWAQRDSEVAALGSNPDGFFKICDINRVLEMPKNVSVVLKGHWWPKGEAQPTAQSGYCVWHQQFRLTLDTID